MDYTDDKKNDENYDILKFKGSKFLMLRKFKYIIFLDSLFDDNITMTYFLEFTSFIMFA